MNISISLNTRKIIILFTLILGFTSCLKHKTVKPIEVVADTSSFPCGDTIYFNAELMTEIFTPSCNISGCHNSTDVAAGYDLTSYTNVSGSADIVLQSIQQSGGLSPMPKYSTKLNDSLINKFDCWIKQGKLNN
jgi:hypothetical protein